MPAKNQDLHGSAPDKCDVALLLIDVVNDLDFPEGDQLLRYALPAARRIADLKARARREGVAVVYVNDNFGRWRSDFRAQVQHCLQDGVRGRPVVELLRPEEDDYFVLKPKHSGFFSTTLDTLLEYLGVRAVVAANICVLFTANDAYMRDFLLAVPADCVASNTKEENDHALDQMRRVLKADIRPSTELSFEALAQARGKGAAPSGISRLRSSAMRRQEVGKRRPEGATFRPCLVAMCPAAWPARRPARTASRSCGPACGPDLGRPCGSDGRGPAETAGRIVRRPGRRRTPPRWPATPRP